MTCEVLVANRLGVALAADSAVTFTKGRSGEQATYSAGANKIFQLSSQEPVAVMIYNAADLQQIPWEVILKAYRSELGSKKFSTLPEYCSDFMEFINCRADKVVPAPVRESSTRRSMIDGASHALHRIIGARNILSNQGANESDHRAAWSEALQELETELAALPVNQLFDEADLPVAQASFIADIAAELEQYVRQDLPHLAPIVESAVVVRLGIEAAFKKPEVVCSTYSGIVVAGYGSDEYMPSFVCHVVSGFVGKRICWRKEKGSSVGHTDRPSLIEPFAQKSMVETFTQGASPEVWKAVRESFTKHAAEVAILAGVKAGVAVDDASASEATEERLGDFTTSWASSVFRAHLSPLHSVVSGLDVESLAELAETLVMLESLKEKVTSRTQAVGGPIDLAVITKAEGLVWLKRKHYFNRELNPRYLLRLQNGI